MSGTQSGFSPEVEPAAKELLPVTDLAAVLAVCEAVDAAPATLPPAAATPATAAAPATPAATFPACPVLVPVVLPLVAPSPAAAEVPASPVVVFPYCVELASDDAAVEPVALNFCLAAPVYPGVKPDPVVHLLSAPPCPVLIFLSKLGNVRWPVFASNLRVEALAARSRSPSLWSAKIFCHPPASTFSFFCHAAKEEKISGETAPTILLAEELPMSAAWLTRFVISSISLPTKPDSCCLPFSTNARLF